MNQSDLETKLTTFNVTIADTPGLPIYHANALVVRSGIDEFFLTLGVIVPPDQVEAEVAAKAGHVVAQPIFRFAISRDTMAKFLAAMAGQFDQQTSLLRQLEGSNEVTEKEEISRNE